MEWFEKIREGMILIKQGCGENSEWVKCHNCPFNNFCDLIMEDSDKTPLEAFFPKGRKPGKGIDPDAEDC